MRQRRPLALRRIDYLALPLPGTPFLSLGPSMSLPEAFLSVLACGAMPNDSIVPSQ